jgi:hypothetical protein
MEILGLTRREALELVIAHLQYQEFNYDRLPKEQRKGHIWEAVRVLKGGLAHEQKHEVKPKLVAGGLVQGY